MNEANLYIQELSVIDNYLKIHVISKIKYDRDVFEPKLKIKFDKGDENLLLPILLVKRSFYSFKDEDYLEFKQRFFINDLFLDNNWKKVKISICLMYGEKFIENFEINSEKDCFLNENSKFIINIGNNNRSFFLEKSQGFKKRNLKFFMSYIVRTVSLIISIILIPFFIFETICIMAKVPFLSSPDNNLYLEDSKTIKIGVKLVLRRIYGFSNFNVEKTVLSLRNFLYNIIYHIIRKLSRKNNQIIFVSERNEKLSGNLKFIYENINNCENISTVIATCNQTFPLSSFKHRIWTYIKLAQANVILLDDYFEPINRFDFNDQLVIQLWHACGAFKTFGFTRLGKPGAPKLNATAHRKYNNVIVSSNNVINCYAEAFGISDEKILPLGIPRTDVFFNDDYARITKNNFYKKYPNLKNKKIILFAPTFRGGNRKSGYYPTKSFDPVKLFNELNNEYAILIKRHFFIKNNFEIPEEYSNLIIDVDVNEDINDLLFITDILITDYSSTIFESCLLNIPMLFYAFDLEEYIFERSFYHEYKNFVPGKIVYSLDELIKSIKDNDFEDYKIESFKNKFFDHIDGKSTKRVTNLILKKLKM